MLFTAAVAAAQTSLLPLPAAPSSPASGATTARPAAEDPRRLDPMYADAWPVSGPPLVDDLHFTLIGNYLYGSVRGSVQVPAGGKPGTTTVDRPRFKEIGISTANIGDAELRASWDPSQEVFFGAQIIQLGGDTTLSRQFVSHGETFPAKTAVSSSVDLNWYRLGYRYTFVVDQTEAGVPTVTITPLADVAVWDFSYDLTAKKLNASRSYTKISGQVGVEAAWRPNGGNFWIDGGVAVFPLFRSVPSIDTEYFALHYRFLQRTRVDVTGTLGVELEQQDYKDRQKVPNHVHADFSPLLMVGLRVNF